MDGFGRTKVRRARWRSPWCVGGSVLALVLVVVGVGAAAATSRVVPKATAAPEPAETTVVPSATTVLPEPSDPAVTSTTQAGSTAPRATVPAPPGVAFVETFDGNAGLERFDSYVFHRNVDIHEYDGLSGGSWSADHDLDCGPPDTQRTMTFDPADSPSTRVANAVYVCRDHVMTSMGDVENYSIVALSPAQIFDSVTEVRVDVNLTDLGNRQWWKIGVLSTTDCPEVDRRCLYSDVEAADLESDLDTAGRLIVSWSGGLSAGHPGGLKIGNTKSDVFVDGGTDKATRHPVSLIDHGDGTVTFRVADQSVTMNGEFPACPCRVVFYDHNYTPDKNEAGPGTQIGYTWHWDNVEVRS